MYSNEPEGHHIAIGDAHSLLGSALGMQGKHHEAIEAYVHALAQVNDEKTALLMGEEYIHLGEWESALPLVETSYKGAHVVRAGLLYVKVL